MDDGRAGGCGDAGGEVAYGAIVIESAPPPIRPLNVIRAVASQTSGVIDPLP